jgi:Serine carboxypeptidase S28
MVTTQPALHHYGSIDVRDGDGDSLINDVQVNEKTSRWMIGSVALLLCGVIAMSLRPVPEAAVSSNHKKDDVKILGKVYRSPSDTPHSFSQKVDHFDPHNHETFQQRYYRKSEYFKGPGHPIILVVGGEDALDDGMFYPFADTFLAERWGAYVLHPGKFVLIMP